MHTSDTSTNDNNNNAFHVFHGTSTMIVVSYNWIVKKKHKSFEIAMSILSYRDCRVISLHLTLLVEDINHDNDEKRSATIDHTSHGLTSNTANTRIRSQRETERQTDSWMIWHRVDPVSRHQRILVVDIATGQRCDTESSKRGTVIIV